jgi:hypothetical protein
LLLVQSFVKKPPGMLPDLRFGQEVPDARAG